MSSTVPAGNASLDVGRTCGTILTRTDLVTRDKLHQLLDSSETDSILFNKPAKALKPHNIVCRVVSIAVSPGRRDQAVFFIDSQSLVGNVQQFCHYADRKERGFRIADFLGESAHLRSDLLADNFIEI